MPTKPNADAFVKAFEFMEHTTQHLARIVENTVGQQRDDEMARLSGSGVASAGGIADVAFQGPPPGWAWEIQRVTTITGSPTAGAGGTADIYLDSILDGMGLLEVITVAQKYSDGPANNIYVPETRSVIVHFAGVTAGATCFVGLQVRRFHQVSQPVHATYDLEAA